MNGAMSMASMSIWNKKTWRSVGKSWGSVIMRGERFNKTIRTRLLELGSKV